MVTEKLLRPHHRRIKDLSMTLRTKHILAGMTLSLLSFSFSAPAETQNAAKTELQHTLANMQQFKADFSQTVKDMDGEIVHEASGKLTMARPDKLRWETIQPDETLLIADGRAVWNVDPFVEQVTIIDQSRAIQDNPMVLLTTESDEQWEKFDIARESDGSYRVTPVNGTGQIQALQLFFENERLSRLIMQDAQAQQSELKFENIQTDFSPALNQFEVTLPDTYTIDDQR